MDEATHQIFIPTGINLSERQRCRLGFPRRQAMPVRFPPQNRRYSLGCLLDCQLRC